MKKILIIIISIIFSGIAGTVLATTYDWILGEPVQTNNTNFDWVLGVPYIVYEIAEAPVSDEPDYGDVWIKSGKTEIKSGQLNIK